MEVQELIKLLQAQDPEAIIIVKGCYGSEGDIEAVRPAVDVCRNKNGKLMPTVDLVTDLCSG